MSKYKIGDKAWQASINHNAKWITCPDCLGDKFLRVIPGDGVEVTIPCTGCSRGYYAPSGLIESWDYEVDVTPITISGVNSQMEDGKEKTEYRRGCCIIEEANLFDGLQEAEKRARELVAEQAAAEEERIKRKVKDHRSWAWHVTYHRGIIRRAKKDIERSEAQLSHALTVAKEAKAAGKLGVVIEDGAVKE